MRQPDDPGLYARTCDCCGRPTRIRERFCDRHEPAPEPWWAHVLRLIDGDSSRVARLLRRVRRGLASLDAWLGGEP